MRLQGLFIASRAGRRIFWTLLVAAAVPLLPFGVAVHQSFDEHLRAQARRQQVQSAKYAGLGLLDRLLTARAVLATAGSAPDAQVLALRGNRRGRVLVDAAQVGLDGSYRAGSRTLWERWQPALAGPDLQRGEDGDARLLVGHHVAPLRDAPVPVAVALRDAQGGGRWWLAELDSDFVFGDLQTAGTAVCVRDAQDRPIACPHADALPPSADGSWRLFLRSDFGSDDWVLSQAPDGQPLRAQSVARTALLGAIAALLVVALLSLTQVRRTMVPLERLIAGTRRLSRGHFDARVKVDQADEFGELARSFNDMAQRIGHQVQTLQVHSSIDREILEGLDISRVLRHVARRLSELAPGGAACVIEFDRNLPLLARLHRAEGDATVVAVPQDDPLRRIRGPAAPSDQPPPWLARSALAEGQGAFVAHAARSGDEVAALLALWLTAERAHDPEVIGELQALADRVAVALASAERERRLVERATRDELTGLSNRLGLFEQVQRLMVGGERRPFSLLFIDLDRFKDVNDAYGHQTGDELLRALAQRLTAAAGDEVLVARPGGDEFVLVVPGARAAADELARQLLAQFSRPMTVSGRALPVDCSVGLAHHPDDGLSALDLMRRADMAMYAAKNDGGCRRAWFEPAMDARQAERTELIADLRRALPRNEFELHCQPRVDARLGEVRCAEALLRWRRNGGELVPPARFIELLEESTLIDDVGLWAIETACRQLGAWRAAGLPLESIAVNISTRQLHSPAFAQRVLTAVRLAGLAPSDLELEITESIFIGNSAEAIAPLRTLRGAGVGIALDDFGTGYSSLSYLHTLPISLLKVDRSFVASLGQRPSAMALTKTIVALAHALNIGVVAEGVETTEQAELLRELGCAKLQGFLFSPPLPDGEFRRFCAELPAPAL